MAKAANLTPIKYSRPSGKLFRAGLIWHADSHSSSPLKAKIDASLHGMSQEAPIMLAMDQLAYKPYCAGLNKYAKVRSRERAVGFPYLQHDRPGLQQVICIDVDSPTDPYFWRDEVAPPPNRVVWDDRNTPHLLYKIEVPVRTGGGFIMPKPLFTLDAVETSLVRLLGGDPAARGSLLQKNPLHPHWDTLAPRDEAWSLTELCDWLTLPDPMERVRERQKAARREAAAGVGRNCDLFDDVRFYAYDHVLDWRRTSTPEAWLAHMLGHVRTRNMDLFPSNPLPPTEEKSIARSVANWVWEKYTGKRKNRGAMAAHLHPSMTLKERQIASGPRSAKVNAATTEAKVKAAIDYLRQTGQPVSKLAVSKAAKVSRNSVSKYWPADL